jgi:hypothetical protein
MITERRIQVDLPFYTTPATETIDLELTTQQTWQAAVVGPDTGCTADPRRKKVCYSADLHMGALRGMPCRKLICG